MNLLEKNGQVFLKWNKNYANHLGHLTFSYHLWQTMWYHPVLAVHAFFPIPSFWFPFHHCSLQMVPLGHYFSACYLLPYDQSSWKPFFHDWCNLSRSLLELDLTFFTIQAVLSLHRFLRLWKTNCVIRKPCKQTNVSTKINRVIWKTVSLGNLYLLFECISEIPCTICSWMVYSNNFEVSWPTDFKIKYCSSGHQKCNIKEKGH